MVRSGVSGAPASFAPTTRALPQVAVDENVHAVGVVVVVGVVSVVPRGTQCGTRARCS